VQEHHDKSQSAVTFACFMSSLFTICERLFKPSVVCMDVGFHLTKKISGIK